MWRVRKVKATWQSWQQLFIEKVGYPWHFKACWLLEGESSEGHIRGENGSRSLWGQSPADLNGWRGAMKYLSRTHGNKAEWTRDQGTKIPLGNSRWSFSLPKTHVYQNSILSSSWDWQQFGNFWRGPNFCHTVNFISMTVQLKLLLFQCPFWCSCDWCDMSLFCLCYLPLGSRRWSPCLWQIWLGIAALVKDGFTR